MKSINQSDVPADFNSVNNSGQNSTEFKAKETIKVEVKSVLRIGSAHNNVRTL
jgi:hypothetical protein